MREVKYWPFSREPVFKVLRSGRKEETGSYTYPKVSIENQTMFVAVRLAKAGYFGGDPEQVMNAPVDVVQSILDYEGFESAYEEEYIALNKS